VRKRSWRWLVAALAAFAVVAAACGDDDDTASGTTAAAGGSATTAAAGGTATTAAGASTKGCGTPGPAATLSSPGSGSADGSKSTVGLVFDVGGKGDKSFNDSADAGFTKALADFKFQGGKELQPDAGGANREELLRTLSGQNYNLIFAIGFAFADAVGKTATDFTKVNYAIIDDASLKNANVKSLTFAEEQSAFLVGAAAALKSKTAHVGFIGGVETDLIKKFQAGYVAGAKQVNPSITVDIKYLTPAGDFSGFNAPDKAKVAAQAMYQAGADVIYHAAGGSGAGLFQAAQDYSESTKKVWAIGTDSDQFLTVPDAQKGCILTSALKRVDVAVYQTAESLAKGTFDASHVVFDLKVDGVGYSTSGGAIDDIKDKLEGYKADIISGKIKVPTTP
jgi:basic membrane protein A